VGSPDFVIAGAGIIGLSLALELDRRGASVTVLDAGAAMQQTSSAAAGMLAVDDPANPPALHPLAQLSASLYPGFLHRIGDLSGSHIPFQTSATLEAGEPLNALADPDQLVPQLNPAGYHFHLLAEHSVDPRQLAATLVAAVSATSIDLREHTSLERIAATPTSVRVQTSGDPLQASYLIDCMGAWSPAPVSPRKGQMLAVRIPSGMNLSCVVRTPDIYIVPRTVGPNAGRAIIGATIEDAGFDLTVHSIDILTLNAKAVSLLPALAEAEFLESWSGLRPATVDGLPILGPAPRQPRYILATGHFRNGILLAPATAHLIAQFLSGEDPSLDLAQFDASRF
jgi:glycine oxidase